MPARPNPPYPVFFSYAHIAGGDFDENPNRAFHTFFDDIGKMLYHLTTFGTDVAFADTSMRAGDSFQKVLFERLAQFRVFVPLLSLRYFESEWCGREWAAFEKRCKELGPASYPPIVPILWNGLEDLSLPEWFTERHLFDDSTQDSLYREHGFFGLQVLYRDDYHAMVYDLARRIGQVSKSADLPDGDPEQLRILPPRFGGSP
ncbi:TIR domain-containing protein [Catenulispora pinisilvae]|uniref:TIR domain-containing protein n=1 Tax=Catenulispora pinisilvae TaxID=2705253 RepID=UPI0018919E2B|nr:toll/interleukin-1 receptor domain-containing protein [Catenulispora pinisilvae]